MSEPPNGLGGRSLPGWVGQATRIWKTYFEEINWAIGVFSSILWPFDLITLPNGSDLAFEGWVVVASAGGFATSNVLFWKYFKRRPLLPTALAIFCIVLMTVIYLEYQRVLSDILGQPTRADYAYEFMLAIAFYFLAFVFIAYIYRYGGRWAIERLST